MAINARKYYVTKSGFGYEEGVYSSTEIVKLPKDAHKYIIPLSVAIARKLIQPDYNSGDSVYDLEFTAAVNADTGEVRKVRGATETSEDSKKIVREASTRKVDNQLQNKMQAFKQKQAEDSLKAKIAAAKAAAGRKN